VPTAISLSTEPWLGFLLQWPTLVTLAMFRILVTVYVRLAGREEREVAAEFGDVWTRYASVTPRWVPRLGGSGAPVGGERSAHG